MAAEWVPFLKMCSQSPISNLTIGHGRTGKPLRTRLQEKRPVFWRSMVLPRQRIPTIGKPVAKTTDILQGDKRLFWRGNDAHWLCEGVQG